tara:strand:+ start:968 stop:1387 length:420 start_codon:yes stop_codon:yes gene_type:complete
MALNSQDFRNSDLSRNYPALKHFSSAEFDSPDDTGSGDNMCPVFLQKLDAARGRAKIPFKINSGYRTPAHNTKVKGSKGSSHMKIPCEAADIHIKDSVSRFMIIVSLMAQGFTRFGIGKHFIHVDGDIKKTQNCIWYYY